MLTSDLSRIQLVRGYVVELYSRSGTARKRFESLLAARGALPIYGGSRHERNCPTAGVTLAYVHREILLLASILDDLFLRDNINIFRAGEHIVRRLYGLEEVLRLCGSGEELEDAHWAAADAYDLPELVDRTAPPLLRARADVNKRLRLSRRRRAVSARRPLRFLRVRVWRPSDKSVQCNRGAQPVCEALAISEALGVVGARQRRLETTQQRHSWRRLPRYRGLPRR